MQSQNVGRGYFRITQRSFFWYHQQAITSLLSVVVVALDEIHFTFYGCSFRRVFLSLITGRRLSFVYRSSRALTNECRMQWMHENLLISDSLNEITSDDDGGEKMTKIHFIFMLTIWKTLINPLHIYSSISIRMLFNPFNITRRSKIACIIQQFHALATIISR